MPTGERAVWPPFVAASIALALAGGFGLGGALFVVLALGSRLDRWWLAAAQAHGHLQLFGWAGLMVLGVALHFLPRLRGAADWQPRRGRLVLGLIVAGLAGRAIVQPLLATAPAEPVASALRVGWGLLAAIELVGVSLAIGLFVGLLRVGPPLRDRPGLWTTLPFFITTLAGLWGAVAASLVGVVTAAERGQAVVDGLLDALTVQIGFDAFLVPVSIAMSARTFPLYFRTPPPRLGILRAGLLLLLIGLVLRSGGRWLGIREAAGLGAWSQAAALFAFVQGLGVFAPRQPLPRQPVRPLADPIQLHAITAYGWLGLVAVLRLLDGLDTLGVGVLAIPGDAERHALGAGFITVLILGMGAHLLPGFARRPLRSRGLVWLTLALGNVAALLRTGPLLLAGALPAPLTSGLLAAAGVAGFAAVGGFAINLLGRPRAATVAGSLVEAGRRPE